MNIHQSFLSPIIAEHNKITLIGMSGLGKSYWSELLVDIGYQRFCCDDMIADQILSACHDIRGNIGCLGDWMGLPTEPDYKTKESIYLKTEAKILSQIIDKVKGSTHDEKIVIDTTGSAPYTGSEIMEMLRENSCILHLATTDRVMHEMLNKYIQAPRPVLWGNHFHQKTSETPRQALERSYRELLRYRESLYRKFAHQSIPYELHHV